MLSDVQIEHELGQRPMKPCHRSEQRDETAAREPRGGVEVHPAGPELHVVARLEVEARRGAPLTHLEVLRLGSPCRDRWMGQVRHLEQHRIQPVPDLAKPLLRRLELFSEA